MSEYDSTLPNGSQMRVEVGCFTQLKRLEILLSRSELKAQILLLMVQGMQRKQIAHLLRRSPHTIDGHIKDLYREMGIGDRAQVILLASQLFIGSFPPPTLGGFTDDLRVRLREQATGYELRPGFFC